MEKISQKIPKTNNWEKKRIAISVYEKDGGVGEFRRNVDCGGQVEL